MKKYGGDFEFHFAQQDGKPIAAAPVVPIDRSAYIADDATAAEIRPRPSDNIAEFIYNTRELLQEALTSLKKEEGGNGFIINPAVYVEDPFRELECQKTVDELDAYSKRLNRVMIDGSNWRSQGAHLWLIAPSCPSNLTQYVQLMDLFIAVPLLFASNALYERMRREKYGRAGSYRLGYGLLEYRVLSSCVIKHPDLLASTMEMANLINAFAHRFLQFRMDMARDFFHTFHVPGGKAENETYMLMLLEKMVQETINNADMVAAQKIVTWMQARFEYSVNENRICLDSSIIAKKFFLSIDMARYTRSSSVAEAMYRLNRNWMIK